MNKIKYILPGLVFMFATEAYAVEETGDEAGDSMGSVGEGITPDHITAAKADAEKDREDRPEVAALDDKAVASCEADNKSETCISAMAEADAAHGVGVEKKTGETGVEIGEAGEAGDEAK
jgi:hypothetical protein